MSNAPQFKSNPFPMSFQQQQLKNFQQPQSQPSTDTITIDAKIYRKFQPPLGEGTEGIVYKGQNVQTNEIVAIKEYKLINKNELQVIQAIQRYKFNNIIGIIGVQLKPDGLPIIVMEFAHGEFYQYMQTDQYQNLNYIDKLSIFVQMLKALQQLHQLKIFHRDMKPENFVYITGPNNKMTIKLIDFGLAKNTEGNMFQTSKVGTPYYMAPEVLRNNNSYDKSVDIWSLGAIWYELLTDETFFQGNSQEEIFFLIQTIAQKDIDRKIDNNNKIQLKEKELMKIMLSKDPQKRQEIFQKFFKPIKEEYESFVEQKRKDVIQYFEKQLEDKKKECKEEFLKFKSLQLDEVRLKNQQLFKQKLKLLKAIENKNQKKEIKAQFQSKKMQKQQNIEYQIEKKWEDYIKQIDDELNNMEFLKKVQDEIDQNEQNFLLNFDNNLMHVQELEENRFLIQQKIQVQEEMDQYKKKKYEEINKDFQMLAQQEKGKIIKLIKESDDLEQILIVESEQSIEKEIEFWKQQEKEKEIKMQELEKEKQRQEIERQKEFQLLEEKKQQYVTQLESFQGPIQSIIQYLNERLQIINKINLLDKKKQELLTYINDEIRKFEEIFLKNDERKKSILQAHTKEMLKEYNQLAKENEQYLAVQKVIIEKIMQEQTQLEQQLKDKEKFELQEQKKKMELETKMKMEQEQKLKKENETEQYKSQLIIVKQQQNQQSSQIQQIQDQLNFYQRIQIENLGEEKFQDVSKYHLQIKQDISTVEFQEKIIQQYESLQQQITTYQSCNRKLEEIQQAQNRFKTQIDEANKCIQQIYRQFMDNHESQIDDLNNKLNDYQDKYKYLSKNSKYSYQITNIINQIGQAFGDLDKLKQLILQRALPAYQEYAQIKQQIQKSLVCFEKQYSQLHQQIYNDELIELKNEERKKKLEIANEQLGEFIIKMNQLKEQVKNFIKDENCNNQETQKLIDSRIINIDQNIKEQQELFRLFTQLIQSDSCENINNQMQQLEVLQRKLKEVEDNEIEYINQLEQIIKKKVEDNKSEQEKEILTLNNQLLTRYGEYTKALQSIKFQFQSVEFYQQMNQKKESLRKELEKEISDLIKYSQIQLENQKILEHKLNVMQTKNAKSKEGENSIKQYLQCNSKKGTTLHQIKDRVIEKKIEFSSMNDNLIKNYEYLKKQEERLSIELQSIKQKTSDQQQNHQELIENLQKVFSDVDELMNKIPNFYDIEQFNKVYQQNLELYETTFALINYIRQYHIKRYYERMKENANQSKKKQQNNKENDYQKQFQSKLNGDQEENTNKEKEAQDLLLRYENVLFKNYHKMTIEAMEKDKNQIEIKTQALENLIKQKDLVKLRAKLKDDNKVKEIINQYYKIFEFSQGFLLQIIRSDQNQH